MPKKVAGDGTEQISIRLPAGLKEFIEWDVEVNKEHPTRNDWLRSAAEMFKASRIEQIALTKDIKGSSPQQKDKK